MAREEAEIKELTKKLEQSPDSMVFVQLADAYRRSGDLEKCVEICVQGLERHPTYTTARTILGRAYLDLGKLDEAAGEFKKIEASDPENIVAQRMLGQIFMQKGLYAEAIVRHQKVLALDPDDGSAQELLQQALTLAKQAAEGGVVKAPAAPVAAPESAGSSDGQSGTIKVAEIYIKKGAFDEATEVLNEVLAADPNNALARQKLKEIEERRNAGQAEAKRKAEEEGQRKAKEESDRKAAEEAKRKADEDAKKRAEEEAQRKAKEESDRKAAEESKRKADEEEAKRKTEEEAARKAAEESKRKADEEAKRKADEEKKSKISSDDILSVMKSDADELIGGDTPAKAAAAPASGGSVAALDPAVKESIGSFLKNNAMEGSLLINHDGKLLDSAMPLGSDAPSLGTTAFSIFSNTEKAAQRMRFGNLSQVIVSSEDGRQILFVSLKSGVLVAVTGKGTNLGQLRIAINDLKRKA
jgi:TolA protein